MRGEYDAELEDVSRILVAMAEAVRAAMSEATASLLSTDAEQAQRVVERDAVIDGYHARVEEQVYALLARHAPVASDLRLLFAALHIAADLERMGDLAEHVAKVGLRRYPSPAVPASLRDIIARMADVAGRIAAKISAVLASPDATPWTRPTGRQGPDAESLAVDAATIGLDDDEMDRLNEGLFVVLLGAAWRDGVESAVDGALLGRFYERYADHAVNAGRRMYFLVTGRTLQKIDIEGFGSPDA
jgi:phosphate transport system protein